MRIHAAWPVILGLALAAGACRREERAAAPLSVAAAASLRELLERAAPLFERAHPGVRLQPSFEASSTLARQIAAGAAFDAFLSADAENVERVRERAQPNTITPFLSNRLALVGRPDLPAPPADPAGLRTLTGKIAVAGPAVPAGKYARTWMRARGLLDALEPRLVNADHVRAALALVEADAADFAFVYATDARVAKRARLLWTAPPAEDPGIVYVAAALRESRHPHAAAFVRWLTEPAFQAEARPLGFSPPGP
jgi:molybdate transport system substrate-binding protein